MKITRRNVLKGIATAGAAGAALAVAGDAEAREGFKLSADDVGMLFDSTLCVGCRACQTACKVRNNLATDDRASQGGVYDAPLDLNGNTKNVIKVAQDGQATTYMKMQCMHCVDPACVSVCMAGALHKVAGGITAYNAATCVGCRYCQIGCPFNVPKYEWQKSLPIAEDPKIVKCELCRHDKRGPACCEVCPRGAVIYGKRADLLAEAKRRIAAAPGKYFQDRVYGEADGGGTNVLYLSPKDVSFNALGLPTLPNEPLPALSENVQHGTYTLGIAPIALYTALTVVQLRARKAEHKEEK
ncbi:MAG: hydrogenase 2 operon protein HybA [Anaeromyxobacteraceae bacterium]|nr:hydrogenase 2 operon protein HybA [Anaeromyxobacteraceae bacterium]